MDQPGFNAMQTFQTDATIVVDALPKVLQGSWEYGTRGYWRTTQNRVAVIGDLLRAGVTMLLVEPDATWIRNVYDQDDLVGNMNNDILGMSDDAGKYLSEGAAREWKHCSYRHSDFYDLIPL